MSFANTLVDPKKFEVGNFYNLPQQIYNSWGIGMFIHQMQDDRINYTNLEIESYYTENFDWDALAAQVASLGYVDYIIFRAKLETGFCHWDTDVKFNGGNSFIYNGVTVPQYGFDFDIGNSYYSGIGVTDDTIKRFISAFKGVGIEPCLDYPIGREYNIRTNMSNAELKNSSDPAIYGKYDEYHHHCKEQIVELVKKFSPQLIWLDNQTKHPWKDNNGNNVRWDNHLDIYNAVKKTNRRTIVGGNLNISDDGGSLYTGNKIQYFPQDIISQEYTAEMTDTSEYADAMTHDGNPYLIPKSRLYDGFYNDSVTSQYVYWDTNAPDAPTNANTPRSQQHFQDEYDTAKSYGATPILNIGPIPASVSGANKHLIDPTYLSRLQNLVI